MAKVVMNENRKGVLEVLTNNKNNNGEAMTLKQIAEAMGVEKLSSGTTNAMVNAGLIKKMGMIKVPVVTYREVETYALGDITIEDLERAEKESKKKEA